MTATAELREAPMIKATPAGAAAPNENMVTTIAMMTSTIAATTAKTAPTIDHVFAFSAASLAFCEGVEPEDAFIDRSAE
jgi:hypothetical protein